MIPHFQNKPMASTVCYHRGKPATLYMLPDPSVWCSQYMAGYRRDDNSVHLSSFDAWCGSANLLLKTHDTCICWSKYG